MDDVLLTEKHGTVTVLTLNRPTKLNALNADLVHALTDALEAAHDDNDVSVVVLAGAGRAFCAGADTSVPRPLTAENRRNLIRHGDHNVALTKLLGRIDKPIIAAVHGYALGAGCGLAFGSDMVVAAESARFGYPELKAGLAATSVTAQAVHLMGRKVAFELLTMCENMLPARAYELGLINRIVPDDQLMTEAMAMAQKLAGWNPEFLAMTKRTFSRALALPPDQALEMAQKADVVIYAISTNTKRDDQDGDKVLRYLTEETGGQAFFPFKVEDLDQNFENIANELRHQYNIFYRPEPLKADGLYHPVTVKVKTRRDLVVKARKGYYAPKL